MGWIYKITNQINGKMYIGKTEHVNPNERWKEHIDEMKRDRSKNRPFYRALNKYGVEKFDFQVIDGCDDSNELCKLEEYYINKYRTFVGFKDCNGYNCTVGGDGKAYLNLDEDEVIRVHIENEYVVKRTAEVFGCDPGSIQNILKKHGVKWLNTLEVIRKKFIDIYGGVVQMSYDCDKVLNIYDTPYDVYSTHEGYKEKTLRCTVNPNNKTHHAYGYTWYRLSELPEEYKPLLREYYTSHLEEDNLEIVDDLEYIYC